MGSCGSSNSKVPLTGSRSEPTVSRSTRDDNAVPQQRQRAPSPPVLDTIPQDLTFHRRGSDCTPEMYEGLPSAWQLVGTGSYGRVLRARNRLTEEEEAVKIIACSDEEDAEAVQVEVDILRRLDHSNVVGYRGCSRQPQAKEVWVACEFCPGGSLEFVAGRLSEEQIAWVCRDALTGLAYLHEQGVLHRDLKAANLLLDSVGRVKIADFGVSAKLTSMSSIRMTLVGTGLWMAPEVIISGEQSGYNTKADVWSFGVTLIELAEGQPPHSTKHVRIALSRILTGPAPTLSRLRTTLLHGGVLPGGGRLHEGLAADGKTAGEPVWSDLFADFLGKALQMDTKVRYSASELLEHGFTHSAPPVGGDVDCGKGLLMLVRQRREESEAERSISARRAREFLQDQGVVDTTVVEDPTVCDGMTTGTSFSQTARTFFERSGDSADGGSGDAPAWRGLLQTIIG
eukprot:Hpha_TRINITY_DN34659_c0_g1::TRINITY_DN34659_c0_g1_i1::g.21074::m.21074